MTCNTTTRQIFWRQIYCNHSRNLGTFVGDKASLTKVFTAEDVHRFSEISLDKNPVHLDEEYARTTRFGKTIVHGVLSVGYVQLGCWLYVSGIYFVYMLFVIVWIL